DWYAVYSSVMCRDDNGRWQANYSNYSGLLGAWRLTVFRISATRPATVPAQATSLQAPPLCDCAASAAELTFCFPASKSLRSIAMYTTESSSAPALNRFQPQTAAFLRGAGCSRDSCCCFVA